MILFTVGTEKFSFDRFSRWIDVLLENKLIDNGSSFFQYGSCKYTSKLSEKSDYLGSEDFDKIVRESNLIVSHCGEGSVLNFSRTDVPYVLVPRSVRFNEHVDDHQIELGTALASLNVPIAWNIADLVKFISNPTKLDLPKIIDTNTEAICDHLHHFFDSN